MSRLNSLQFKDRRGQTFTIDFLHADASTDGFHTTIITGKNGTNKSLVLNYIVKEVLEHEDHVGISVVLDAPNLKGPIICLSGSVADRFPIPERAGRGRAFITPEYTYLGQRVGANLLSKKRPLEAMVAAALNPLVRNRYEWPFYRFAHQLAGICPGIRITISKKSISSVEDFYGEISKIALLGVTYGESASPVLRLPEKMAQYLLSSFQGEQFRELSRFLVGRGSRKAEIILGEDGPREEGPNRLSLQAIRLGLLAGVLTVSQALVSRMDPFASYSAFELSSGEYQMLTSILGLGFTIEDGAVVLIDEPENSLHPQWQREFIDFLTTLFSQFSSGHAVISTHSPLVVASAPAGGTIVELASDGVGAITHEASYGISAEKALFSEFGLASSRNIYVADLVQRAVHLVEAGNTESDEFEASSIEIRNIKSGLSEGDPLMDVIDALLAIGDRA